MIMQTFLNKLILLTTTILTILTGCDKRNILGGEDDRLLIKNNSDKDIYTYAQSNYPDTSISSYNPSFSKENYLVLAHSEKRLISRSWEQDIIRGQSDTLMIFLYDAQVLDSILWDTVKTNYLVLKRYDLSLQDLESMNWTVTYP
jgi:hypothetical protein